MSNVSVFAEIAEASTVLDVGCGAGLVSLVAAHSTGPRGRVIGLDFSPEMIARARPAAQAAGLGQCEIVKGDAERLPLEDASVDTVLVNGIFNLNPARLPCRMQSAGSPAAPAGMEMRWMP